MGNKRMNECQPLLRGIVNKDFCSMRSKASRFISHVYEHVVNSQTEQFQMKLSLKNFYGYKIFKQEYKKATF